MRIYVSIISLISMIFCSCNNNFHELKKYYNDNKILHEELADGLCNLVKQNKTSEITIRKRSDSQKLIVFRQYFSDNNSRMPIEFDSLFQRHDPYPNYTSQIEVPIDIIKLFKKSCYTALIADSSEVFFGYKDNSDGNTKLGIVIDKEPGRDKSRYIKQLADRAFIANGIIP
jgi:hypothetical protein